AKATDPYQVESEVAGNIANALNKTRTVIPEIGKALRLSVLESSHYLIDQLINAVTNAISSAKTALNDASAVVTAGGEGLEDNIIANIDDATSVLQQSRADAYRLSLYKLGSVVGLREGSDGSLDDSNLA